MHPFAAGQRWSYRTREQDPSSTLVIGKVQNDFHGQTVLHISVEGVVRPDSPLPIEIGHMPFSAEAIEASVLELLESDIQLPDGLFEGITVWEEQQGGVFTITVAEAVDALVTMVPPPQDDGFDQIVVEMRERRTDEMVEVLYRELFALETWFFLCEPDNVQAAVQWTFSDGHNPAPALLAFTSRERAQSAAVELGIYPEGSEIYVMPAPVAEAVPWFAGDSCANDWACFNLTQENFPLYADDAMRMLGAG